jgi:hypothetical protein
MFDSLGVEIPRGALSMVYRWLPGVGCKNKGNAFAVPMV